jgi:hypothetical protein
LYSAQLTSWWARLRKLKDTGSSKVISAGDEDRNFCGRIGLHSVDDAKHSTWPASCTKFGSGRGDNICSNLRVAQPEQTFLPCLNRYGIPAKIGDQISVKAQQMMSACDIAFRGNPGKTFPSIL